MSAGALLLFKLAGVGLVVLAASLVARRHGHRAGGLLAGLPLIAGPVTGLLLLTQPASWVQQLAVGTLACLPATVAHQLCFAWVTRQAGAGLSLLAANGLFLAVGAVLVALAPGLWLAAGLALAALLLGRRAMPAAKPAAESAPVSRPGRDLVLRVAAALGLAAVLLLGAERLPPALGGLLLALPIAGNVLPAFARSSGPAAALALLRGFLTGLGAFFGFFSLLAIGLALGSALDGSASGPAATALAFAAAVVGAPLAGWLLSRA